MPRKARSYSDAPYYHVMVQGIKKEYIFKDDNLKLAYLRILKKYIEESDLKLIAYCIMGTHSHLLFKVERVKDLIKCMSKLNTTFAKYYNKIYDRVGYVFRDRYASEEIYELYYLHNCIKYIHMNPVKAKICSKQSEYKFSSYNSYVRKDFLPLEIYSSIFPIEEEYFKAIDENESECYFMDEKADKEQLEMWLNEYLDKKKLKLDMCVNDKVYLKQLILDLYSEYKVNAVDIASLIKDEDWKVRRILTKIKKSFS